ncbi:bifunctional oligoribonuclease/PAP phosphatase NrnA [Calditrichota bacterium]
MISDKNSNGKNILDFLEGDDEILVVSHFSPDGDAIGSMLAFGGILDQLGVDHTIVVDDIPPDKYNFMPDYKKIRSLRENPLDRKFRKVVILDAGAIGRIGDAQKLIEKDAQILNIDHHFTGNPYGTVNIINSEASATAEMLYDICQELNIQVDLTIAYALYVGILTDTGRFRFANSSSRAMSICAELLSKGVDAGWVTENVYFNLPFELIQALAKSLLTLELHHDGLVCVLRLDHGHYIDDSEWFVGYASSIKGVAMAAFICEMDPGVYKVSLRSRCKVAVSEVARKFGGGGHLKAAGFRYRGKLNDLVPELLSELGREIETEGIRPGDFFVEPASADTVGSQAEWEFTEAEKGER